MSPNEFQKACLRTEKTPDFISPDFAPPPANRMTSRLLHGMFGICTEAGELQDMMKKHLFYGKPLDHTNVMEECFDVMWYVSLCLDAAGFTMEQAMERGLAKLQARYPNGFTEEAALCRNLTAERRELEQPETPPSQDRIMRLFAAQVARALVIERIKRIEKYELPDNFNVGVEIVPGRTTSKSYTANLRIDDVSATVTINTADEAADMAVATAQLVAIWLNQHVVKQPLYANPA